MDRKRVAPPTEQPATMERVYLLLLRSWVQGRGYAPSITELATHARKSRTAIYSAFRSLYDKRWVTTVGAGKNLRYVPVELVHLVAQP